MYLPWKHWGKQKKNLNLNAAIGAHKNLYKYLKNARVSSIAGGAINTSNYRIRIDGSVFTHLCISTAIGACQFMFMNFYFFLFIYNLREPAQFLFQITSWCWFVFFLFNRIIESRNDCVNCGTGDDRILLTKAF